MAPITTYGRNCCSPCRLNSHSPVHSALMKVFSKCIISQGCCGILLKIFFPLFQFLIDCSQQLIFTYCCNCDIAKASCALVQVKQNCYSTTMILQYNCVIITMISGDMSYCVLFTGCILGSSSTSLVSWEIMFLDQQLTTEYQIRLVPGVHKAHSLPRNVP